LVKDNILIDLEFAHKLVLPDDTAANLQKATDAMTCLGSKIRLNINVGKRKVHQKSKLHQNTTNTFC